MRLKPELKGALWTLLCIVLILVGFWFVTGIRLGIWTPIQYHRYIWLTENLQIANRLWHGETKAGDDAEQLIKDWRPHMITRYGPWIEMRWFPGGIDTNFISFIGMYVLAKDGKLVAASSYADDGVDDRVFFNTLTPVQQTAELEALKAYVENVIAERKKASAGNANKLFISETNQAR